MTKKETLGAKKESVEAQNDNFITKLFSFFKKYSNLVYGIVIAILVIAIGIICFNRFYLQPRAEKASLAMTKPIEYLMTASQTADSTAFMLALEGDEEFDGFLNIISDYKMTPTANTAKYMAGVCYFGLKDYETAAEYLQQFKQKEDYIWYGCQGLIGDCYDELGDTEKALAFYNKSIKNKKNDFYNATTLFKIGQIYERESNWEKAYEAYSTIQNDYATEYANMGIDRYLERAKVNAGK